MTEKKPRAPAALTAERFITKLRRRASTEHSRHDAARIDARIKADARFAERENAWRCNMLARVSERERGPAVDMARALRLTIDAPPAQEPPRIGPPLFISADEIDEEPALAEVDKEAPDHEDQPADPAPVPRGVTDYTPGPVAQAALGRRR